jgi:hypothetical protein
MWGEPSDAGLTSLGAFGGNPDLSGRGAIYGNAVSTVEAGEARRAEAIVRRRWAEAAFTWIILDGRCMITVYTLHFDDADAAAAHAANRAIVEELRAASLPQYRLDIGTPGAPGAEAITVRLKAAFDPLGLVAPGRYEP